MRLAIIIAIVSMTASTAEWIEKRRTADSSVVEEAGEQRGIASWYGEEEVNDGQAYTASGELFRPELNTCASWDYKFGTVLYVENVETGAWTLCRVNDRGPRLGLNRLIDLSMKTFQDIGSLSDGLIEVAIQPVDIVQ